jgi:fatty-acyl-CoA synthase
MAATSTFRNADDIASFASVPLEMRLGNKDLAGMIDDATGKDGDATAIQFLPSGTTDGELLRFSRRQLCDAAAAIAARLADAGLGRDDVVASLLPNGPGTVAAAIATMSMATLAPINVYLDPSQIRKLLEECEARAVLVPRDAPAAIADTLAAVRTGLGRNAPSLLEVDIAALPRPATPAAAPAMRALAERVAMFHTGGTTALPKFVPLTARNLAAGAIISQFAYGYGEADHVLCAMPMFHVGGLFACSLFPLASGSRITILGPLGYRGEGVVRALPKTIAALEASVVVGPPTVMAQLAANPPDRTTARHLRLFINGAAALPRVAGTRLVEGTGVPVVEPWGLTEATLAVTSGPRDGAIRQGSVGLPLPYCEVKAVRTDASGRAIGDCEPDEIGILAVRGPMVFGGYLKRPAEAQPFFDGGWLDTGDLGRIDRDGHVWVTGRAKELIKRGGHGIDPGVIEDALMAHPAVALAAAIGKPDAYAGEVPVAYVQLHPEATVGSEELIEFAREHIPERAAVPKEIIAIAKLPLTAIGKVHKLTLKLDITRRAAEDCARRVVGGGEAFHVSVEPHPLHGLQACLRVPARHVEGVREALAAFPFRSETTALEQEGIR